MRRVVNYKGVKEMAVEEWKESKLYVCCIRKEWYKLQRVSIGHAYGPDKWVWARLNDSLCYRNGFHDSGKAAIKSLIMCYDVYEFDNVNKFAQYILGD